MLGKLKCKVPLILTRLPTSTRHQLHKHPHNHRAHVSPPSPLSPQLTQNHGGAGVIVFILSYSASGNRLGRFGKGFSGRFFFRQEARGPTRAAQRLFG